MTTPKVSLKEVRTRSKEYRESCHDALGGEAKRQECDLSDEDASQYVVVCHLSFLESVALAFAWQPLLSRVDERKSSGRSRERQEQPDRVLPKVSQETLASMVGTTRSRVNFFMNKFRKLGFIEYNGKITVNKSLLTVVLHE